MCMQELEHAKPPRALVVGQTHRSNLLHAIAQCTRYAPDATNINRANKFMIQGEKRYWLPIVLDRDLVSGQVDVLGTQLDEVVEQPKQLIRLRRGYGGRGVDPPSIAAATCGVTSG
jgi:hypothetical protein